MAQDGSLTTDFVTDYAQSVTDGIIVAGPHVRAACKRHLDDLVNAQARGYRFDLDKASRVIEFFQEVLKLNGGHFEGVAYDPLPWQKFILGSIFGWVDKDGNRRFRIAYVETSKGSGKSPLAGGIGLYCLMADNEPRAEIYAAAATKDQAMILFRDAVAMAELSPELSARLIKSGVGERAWNIAYPETGSFFRPIASDDTQAGKRPHCALLDEIHEHKNSTMVDQLEAGTKGRRQALIFMITNSGYDKSTICGIQHDYAIQVAGGMKEDDNFFSYVCALDKGENPFADESCWIKTNPSLGITIQPKYLRDRVNKAMGMPSMESIVRRLNFSEWVGAANPWLAYDAWIENQEHYGQEQLVGRRCWGGLDLSSTQDLTSLMLLFEPVENDPVWRFLPYFWLPAQGLQAKADRDKVDYLTWVRDGYLETTPSFAIDKTFVLHRLAQINSVFDLQSVAYDRWRIADLKQLAENEGINLVFSDFGQGFKDMAPAVDEFETRLLARELKHNGNPCLTWCAANTVMATDPAGNRKPAKNKSTGRIDGIVAGVMAVGASMQEEETHAGIIDLWA